MRLIPPIDYIKSQSNAEKKVANILQQLIANDAEVAYHSVHLPEHEYKRMSEIDFLVLWKGVAIVLEVKGGRVKCEHGVWIFTDRYGNYNTKSESPWDQGRSAMFALQKRVQHKYPNTRYLYTSLVVTPDQELDPSFEWTADEHIGSSQMTVSKFEQALDKASKNIRGNTPIGQMASWSDLKKFVRPDFDRLPTLLQQGRNINEEMAKFADEQLEILDGLESNPRVIIEGGAGSGKTLLAIEAAKRASTSGARVLFTCVSSAVIDQAKTLLEGSTVAAFDFNNIPGDKFDVLVIDEGQDLVNFKDLIDLDGVLNGGLHSGSWWLFCDPNNQAHVTGSFDADAYEDLRGNSTKYSLKKNHRNTKPIVEMVKQVLGADLGTPKIGAGPAVKFPNVSSRKAAISELDNALEEMVAQEIQISSINFISFSENFDNSYIYQTDFSKKFKITSNPTDGNPTIWTPARIKGLERDYIFVTDVEELYDAKSLSMLYVSMTRARVSLWVGVSSSARQILDEIAKQQIMNEVKQEDRSIRND